MSELIHWDSYEPPVPARRQTRKQIAEVEQGEIVRRARHEAAARDAQNRLKVEEQLAAGRALLRVKGVYDTADYAKDRATGFNHASGLQSAGNPRLGQIHRSFEDTAAVVSNLVMQYYGTDR